MPSTEEIRHLRRAFDHMAGLAKRQTITTAVDKALDRVLKLQDFLKLNHSLDSSVTSLTHEQAASEVKAIQVWVVAGRG